MGTAPGQSYRRINDLLIHRDYVETLGRADLDCVDALMSASSQFDLQKASLARWRQRLMVSVDGTPMYLKRYDRPPLAEQFRQRLRGFAATATVEWLWLHHVRQLGIGAPLPVAFGAQRRGPLVERRSVLLLSEAHGCSLESWVPDQLFGQPTSAGLKTRVSRALAELVSQLHSAGLIHCDLYLSHVFIAEKKHEAIELTLIDLQRMIQPRFRWHRWLVKDLAALNYSAPRQAATVTDRVRWLRRYRGRARLSFSDKALIRDIVAKTRRIEARSHRQRRVAPAMTEEPGAR